MGFLLVLMILAGAGWAGATWFIGQETEKYLRANLDDSNVETDSPVMQRLVSYENTSFRTAKLITHLTFGIPIIDNVLEDANWIVNIQHGPLVLQDNALKPAASYWDVSLDMTSLDEDARATLMDWFGEQAPLFGNVIVQFDKNIDFNLVLSAINKQDANGAISIAGGHVNGQVLMPEAHSVAKITLDQAYMRTIDYELSVPVINADINMTGYAGTQVLGSNSVIANNVKITPVGAAQSITLDILQQSSNDAENGLLSGNGSLVFENINEASGTFKNIKINSDFAGLDVEGLDQVSVLQSEINAQQKQLLWNMDATHSPEGQDKMMDLSAQIQALNEQLFAVLFDKVLVANQSQLKAGFMLNGNKGDADASLDLRYVGGNKAITINDVMLGKTDDLLSAFELSLSGQSDKSILNKEFSVLMEMLTLQGILTEKGKKFQIDASMRDSLIALNGKPMSFDELTMLFMPQEAAMLESVDTMAIPPDIEQRIQEEGLSPEVMQILEESEDINPVLLQQLKELSDMQQGR